MTAELSPRYIFNVAAAADTAAASNAVQAPGAADTEADGAE
jgi:hypothetical protein